MPDTFSSVTLMLLQPNAKALALVSLTFLFIPLTEVSLVTSSSYIDQKIKKPILLKGLCILLSLSFQVSSFVKKAVIPFLKLNR